MILEFSLDYRSSSLVYEKVFLQILKEHNLVGKIVKNHFTLNLYVEAETTEALEEFVTDFSSSLPHSIFLYHSDAKIVDEMPESDYKIPQKEKLPLPFCPKCLKKVMDKEDKDYYNIFTECDICGYSFSGEQRSYKSEFEKIANKIKEGKIIELNTFYGKYYVGVPNEICNSIPFDILAYDLATIEKYTNVEKHEITTLGAFEKPLIKLKKKIKFTMDYEEVEADLIRFKLSDDFILHLLMEELHQVGIDVIFITKEDIPVQEKLLLVDFKEELEPIEVVGSEKNITIISGTKGLPLFPINSTKVNPAVGSIFSVIKEHNLKDENIAGINLSKKYENSILVYGQKYGVIQYLSMNFKFSSMQEIFDKIKATDDTGIKIIENYKKKFPEHFDMVSKIVFEDTTFNIFNLWGVIAMVLEFTNIEDPFEAGEVLEDNAMNFLGEKGPRIDYKLLNIDGKVYLDPLMTIRTAMSFRLAGVDNLMLSYGVIESFLEFLSNEIDELKQNMNISAVVVAGSMLSNKHLFSKLSREVSMNHDIYFNNELCVEGDSMFYGGTSLE